jgi:hypothetical protein
MLDLTGIMFSSIMMLIVIIRATKLDLSEPWFQKVKFKDAKSATDRRTWQRQKPL